MIGRRLLPALGLILGGCLAPGTAHLEALGVRRTLEQGAWSRFASAFDGYEFEMPGVPLAEAETYHFDGRRIDAVFFDLSTELDSRAFLLRVFDAGALDDEAREALRRQVEDQIARSGDRVDSRRGVGERGAPYYEVLVANVTLNQHDAFVRTFVAGGLVVQMVVIAPSGSGAPSEVTHYFDSFRTERQSTSAPSR